MKGIPNQTKAPGPGQGFLVIQLEPIGLDVEGAAALTSFSVETLNEFRVKGGGPRFHKSGRKVVYTPADLREWVDSLPAFRNTTEADLARR